MRSSTRAFWRTSITFYRSERSPICSLRRRICLRWGTDCARIIWKWLDKGRTPAYWMTSCLISFWPVCSRTSIWCCSWTKPAIIFAITVECTLDLWTTQRWFGSCLGQRRLSWKWLTAIWRGWTLMTILNQIWLFSLEMPTQRCSNILLECSLSWSGCIMSLLLITLNWWTAIKSYWSRSRRTCNPKSANWLTVCRRWLTQKRIMRIWPSNWMIIRPS